FFLFQAEDGIRDATVTGVQTCALPISDRRMADVRQGPRDERRQLGNEGRALRPGVPHQRAQLERAVAAGDAVEAGDAVDVDQQRSEERRVGEEWGDGVESEQQKTWQRQ